MKMMTNVTETMDYYADELKDADRVEAVYEVFKEKGFIERSVHMAPLINVFMSKVTKFKAFRNFFFSVALRSCTGREIFFVKFRGKN